MSKYTPTIGIVIAVTGKVDHLIEAWKPVLDKGENVDFVFVESGTSKEISTHNRSICLDNNIRRHWVPRNGKHAKCDARNFGARKVEGEYIWFVDGDCYPHKDALKNLQQIVMPDAIICGHILFPQPDGVMWGDHREQIFGRRKNTIVNNYPWAMSEPNSCYPRTLFESVGGFNIDWAVSGWCPEGLELYWRIFCKHFTPLLLTREVTVEHQWHAPSPERVIAQETGENNEPLRKQMMKTAEEYGILNHPKIQEILLAFQGEYHLDSR